MTEIDVVIPAHQKDIVTLGHCIDGIKKNILGLRRIIVVSKEKYSDKAEWFDEKLYPFSYKEISDLVAGSNVGWNYQQLLKLYAALVIPGISPNVLVIDADTVFYRKVKFFDEGKPLYNLSKDKNLNADNFYQTTLDHIKKILPEVAQKFPKSFENISGICHHMLFQKHVIEDLFSRIEQHDGSGDPFYKIFLRTAKNSFGVAEYNLYFYFLISHYPNDYKIRILKYKNTAKFSPLTERLRRKYHYCSYHSYMRDEVTQQQAVSGKSKVGKLFFLEQWNIGILDFPLEKILEKEIKISWLKNPCKARFYADCFGFDKFVVYEDYSQILKRGRIAIAEIENQKLVRKKIILDDKKHLSYPFIIEHEGRVFMLCEAYKAKNLSLYEIDKKTLKAKKLREIFSNSEAIDPTIFYHQNKFWLFYTSANDANSELHIAFADSLFSEFKFHKKNPVKFDKSSSRPAGNIFISNGKIYRPTQNCSQTYGGSIVINEITKLDEENFEEKFVKEIKPNSQDLYNKGLHTISKFGNQTLIDGKREVFVIYKPLISLSRNLKKLLVN